MRELSIFIDESGDFGDRVILPSYYLVTLVFHDQEEPILSQIHQLEESTHNAGFDLDYIHTGPLIRREDVFSRYSIDDRRKLIYKILNFMNFVPILHDTIAVNRKNFSDRMTLIGRLSRIKSGLISISFLFLLLFFLLGFFILKTETYPHLLCCFCVKLNCLNALLITYLQIHFCIPFCEWLGSGMQKEPVVEDDHRLRQPKMGARNYGGSIFVPNTAFITVH
ncbi:MAG: hypothetical protein PUG36_02440 [Clostridiales bacterium]|nr:hypothetical protein [Clostridiales bacterium]